MAGQLLQLAANLPGVLQEPALEAPIGLAEQVATAALGRLVEISGQGDAARLTLAVDVVRQVQAEGETAAWVQPAGGPLYPPDLQESCVDLDSLIVIHVPPGAGPYGVPRAAELLLRSGGFGLVVLDLTGPGPAASPLISGGRPPVIPGTPPVIPGAPPVIPGAPPVIPGTPPVIAGAPPVIPGAPPVISSAARNLEARDDVRRSLPSVWRRGTGWQGRLLGLVREHGSRVVCITETPSSGESLGPLVALRVQPVRVRVGEGLFAIKPRVLRNKPALDLQRAVQRRRGPWGLE